MTTKMKGIYKGFKYISQIFVVKDANELEIGYPTDVKHVAHIGWDGASGTPPSWMNEFKNGPEFSPSSIGNVVERRDSNPISFSPWSSQDFEQTMGDEPMCEMFKDLPPKLPSAPKKHKRKKTKSTSSPKSSTTKSSRASKSKVDYCEINMSPRLQGV